jgi:hypothetical protein
MTTKICRQCAYRRRGDICGHPKAEQNPHIDFITGKVTVQGNLNCEIMRKIDFLCDYDGKYWQPKPPKQPLIQRIIQFFKRTHEPTQKD